MEISGISRDSASCNRSTAQQFLFNRILQKKVLVSGTTKWHPSPELLSQYPNVFPHCYRCLLLVLNCRGVELVGRDIFPDFIK